MIDIPARRHTAHDHAGFPITASHEMPMKHRERAWVFPAL
jgi:hypothetical protein